MTWINVNDCIPLPYDQVIVCDGHNIEIAWIDGFNNWRLQNEMSYPFDIRYWHPIPKLARAREARDKADVNKNSCIKALKQSLSQNSTKEGYEERGNGFFH